MLKFLSKIFHFWIMNEAEAKAFYYDTDCGYSRLMCDRMKDWSRYRKALMFLPKDIEQKWKQEYKD